MDELNKQYRKKLFKHYKKEKNTQLQNTIMLYMIMQNTPECQQQVLSGRSSSYDIDIDSFFNAKSQMVEVVKKLDITLKDQFLQSKYSLSSPDSTSLNKKLDSVEGVFNVEKPQHFIFQEEQLENLSEEKPLEIKTQLETQIQLNQDVLTQNSRKRKHNEITDNKEESQGNGELEEIIQKKIKSDQTRNEQLISQSELEELQNGQNTNKNENSLITEYEENVIQNSGKQLKKPQENIGSSKSDIIQDDEKIYGIISTELADQILDEKHIAENKEIQEDFENIQVEDQNKNQKENIGKTVQVNEESQLNTDKFESSSQKISDTFDQNIIVIEELKLKELQKNSQQNVQIENANEENFENIQEIKDGSIEDIKIQDKQEQNSENQLEEQNMKQKEEESLELDPEAIKINDSRDEKESIEEIQKDNKEEEENKVEQDITSQQQQENQKQEDQEQIQSQTDLKQPKEQCDQVELNEGKKDCLEKSIQQENLQNIDEEKIEQSNNREDIIEDSCTELLRKQFQKIKETDESEITSQVQCQQSDYFQRSPINKFQGVQVLSIESVEDEEENIVQKQIDEANEKMQIEDELIKHEKLKQQGNCESTKLNDGPSQQNKQEQLQLDQMDIEEKVIVEEQQDKSTPSKTEITNNEQNKEMVIEESQINIVDDNKEQSEKQSDQMIVNNHSNNNSDNNQSEIQINPINKQDTQEFVKPNHEQIVDYQLQDDKKQLIEQEKPNFQEIILLEDENEIVQSQDNHEKQHVLEKKNFNISSQEKEIKKIVIQEQKNFKEEFDFEINGQEIINLYSIDFFYRNQKFLKKIKEKKQEEQKLQYESLACQNNIFKTPYPQQNKLIDQNRNFLLSRSKDDIRNGIETKSAYLKNDDTPNYIQSSTQSQILKQGIIPSQQAPDSIKNVISKIPLYPQEIQQQKQSLSNQSNQQSKQTYQEKSKKLPQTTNQEIGKDGKGSATSNSQQQKRQNDQFLSQEKEMMLKNRQKSLQQGIQQYPQKQEKLKDASKQDNKINLNQMINNSAYPSSVIQIQNPTVHIPFRQKSPPQNNSNFIDLESEISEEEQIKRAPQNISPYVNKNQNRNRLGKESRVVENENFSSDIIEITDSKEAKALFNQSKQSQHKNEGYIDQQQQRQQSTKFYNIEDDSNEVQESSNKQLTNRQLQDFSKKNLLNMNQMQHSRLKQQTQQQQQIISDDDESNNNIQQMHKQKMHPSNMYMLNQSGGLPPHSHPPPYMTDPSLSQYPYQDMFLLHSQAAARSQGGPIPPNSQHHNMFLPQSHQYSPFVAPVHQLSTGYQFNPNLGSYNQGHHPYYSRSLHNYQGVPQPRVPHQMDDQYSQNGKDSNDEYYQSMQQQQINREQSKKGQQIKDKINNNNNNNNNNVINYEASSSESLQPLTKQSMNSIAAQQQFQQSQKNQHQSAHLSQYPTMYGFPSHQLQGQSQHPSHMVSYNGIPYGSQDMANYFSSQGYPFQPPLQQYQYPPINQAAAAAASYGKQYLGNQHPPEKDRNPTQGGRVD